MLRGLQIALQNQFRWSMPLKREMSCCHESPAVLYSAVGKTEQSSQKSGGQHHNRTHSGGCCGSAVSVHRPSGARANFCSTPAQILDTCFEVNSVPWKFGEGAIDELGVDVRQFEATRVCVFTDSSVKQTPFFRRALDALKAQPTLDVVVYDQVRIEPSEQSILEATKFITHLDSNPNTSPQCFVSIGGGSVIDTLKASSLYDILRRLVCFFSKKNH